MANGITGFANLQRSELPITLNDSSKNITESLASDLLSEPGPDFADAFADAIGSASADERVANEMELKFADGDPDVGIHEVVIASEKANLSLRYTVTLKNKLLEAYRELMSTQV